MNKPPSFLFVCLGNICRSPLAEGIFLHLNEIHKKNFIIDSAGTASYHVGEPPDPRTVRQALGRGIDLRNLRARQFKPNDFLKFDHIFVMDKSNLRNVLTLASCDADASKVSLLLDHYPECGLREVPDPYYGGPEGFEEVFDLVYGACERIFKKHL
ncbi:MAG: low molecular weight phosphotyrosine protein phosphatase [Bacteroidia bacterium]|nr:low molecular weight phosphotyrosine protein phosphatase [Bacteroidia bacterium]